MPSPLNYDKFTAGGDVKKLSSPSDCDKLTAGGGT